LEYRRQTVHFSSQERIAATRDYIASQARRSADFLSHKEFLENLPTAFLKASARNRVVRLLHRLLAQAA
jgi:hypothetical protein